MEKLIVVLLVFLLVGCQGEPLAVEIQSKQPSNYAVFDGEITLDITGGKAPYNVVVNNDHANQIITHLNAGEYVIEVTDSKNQMYKEVINLYAPLEVGYELNEHIEDLEKKAELILSIGGGKAPYRILLNNEVYTEDYLSSGEYVLRVTDDNGEVVEVDLIIEPLTESTMTDAEGNEYPIVKIGDQWWMASNLKLKEGLTCYSYMDDTSYDDHGYLYDYENAMKIDVEGWHVPTHEDFMILEMYLGMSEKDANRIGSSSRGTDMGRRLQPTGDTGFNGTLSGWYAGEEHGYGGMNEGVAYWTSDLYDESSAIVRTLMKGDGRILCYPDPFDWRFYIRLVKDQN